MNIDNQILYIIILIFSCLVLLCITLMYLYMNAISKYTKIRTAGLSEKDESVINNAKEIAQKIIDSAKKLDEKHDSIMAKVVGDISLKWSQSAETIFNKNVKELDTLLNNKIQEIYKKENDSLESYKKEKLNDFNKEMSETVNKLAKAIIKREIDINQHNELIKDGLERAKKSGLFK